MNATTTTTTAATTVTVFENCSSPYTGYEYAIVAGLSAGAGFISLLASCFIVFLIVLFKKWKFFAQRLVLYLAISVILESIATIIHRVDYENQTSAFYVTFCKFAGFMEQNTSWMQLMAVVSITVYVFAYAMFRKRTDRLVHELVFLFFIFVFPLLFNWIPFTRDDYGRAGAWCWIRSENIYTCEESLSGQILQFVLWYIPLYIIIIVLICLYVAILVKMQWYDKRKWRGSYVREDEYSQSQSSKEIKSLLSYPIIYFVFSLIPLINRIYSLKEPNPNLVLWILSSILFPLQGGIIALAYTLDPGTRKRLKPVLLKSAAEELCQKNSKEVVREYPAEHITASCESFAGLKAKYHAVDMDGEQQK